MERLTVDFAGGLDEYIDCLAGEPQEIRAELNADGEYARLLEKYIRKRNYLFFAKLRYAARLMRALGCEYRSALNKIRTPLIVKPVAYMTDSGTFCISAGYTVKADPCQLLKLVLHEFSHLVLAERADYPELKKLDGKFFEAYGKSETTVPVSPVEYYATIVSAAFIESSTAILGERGEGLRLEAEAEREKLKRLYISLRRDIRQ